MLTAQVMEGAFLFWGVRAGTPSPGMLLFKGSRCLLEENSVTKTTTGPA